MRTDILASPIGGTGVGLKPERRASHHGIGQIAPVSAEAFDRPRARHGTQAQRAILRAGQGCYLHETALGLRPLFAMAWLHRSLALVAQGRHGPCLLGLFSLALAGPTAAGEETRGEGGASGPWEGNGAPASPSHATPVVGASLCPTPDAVWQELLTLLPRDDLVGRLRSFGSAGAAVRIEDLGASFRVSLLDKARAYHEEARDCARRARMGALFAALVIDPTALLGSNALEV
ncbi:MAG TPA: hypothetical protein VMK12_29490, partial [Anaeromyxobacteraceae bacterium]|nr:hypothetical protein [Anaeromyxobacteraceae bacterium]